MAGIAVGPHGLGIAPKPDALMMIGEFGLVLMVLEAGVEVDLEQLALVGRRGVLVAFAGSLVPLAIGATLGTLVFDMSAKSALAVGASLAPTSMGISLKVLQDGGVLGTPTGQLIIAAAVIDDVIALVLLSELEALRDPTPVNFIVPIVSSVAFIAVVGYSAIHVVPAFLVDRLVPRVPKQKLEGVLLGMVFCVAYVLMVVLHYGRSSHLLGAFLGGLCFCSLASMQRVWHAQVEKILSWLVRVFFACTIGFEVPIRDLWTGPVLARTGVFLLAGFGKVGTGLFAKPFRASEAAKIGFAMSAWGEFAFIVATASKEAGTLGHEDYSAVILAVLLSAVYAPYAVKSAIDHEKRLKNARSVPERLGSKPSDGGSDARSTSFGGCFSFSSDVETGGGGDVEDGSSRVLHRVYYVATIACPSRWGLNDDILRAVHDPSVHLEVLDVDIKPRGGFSTCELFLRDPDLRAPLDALVACKENHAVDAKIPVLTAALEAMTLKPKGDENAGSTATFSSSKDAKDPRGALAGEVLLARWVPDLRDPAVDPSGDPSSRNPDDELDDSIARKQAGDLLRGGGEKDDGDASAEVRDVSLSAGIAYAARAAGDDEDAAGDAGNAADSSSPRGLRRRSRDEGLGVALTRAKSRQSLDGGGDASGRGGGEAGEEVQKLQKTVFRTGSLVNLLEAGGSPPARESALANSLAQGRAMRQPSARGGLGMGAVRRLSNRADESPNASLDKAAATELADAIRRRSPDLADATDAGGFVANGPRSRRVSVGERAARVSVGSVDFLAASPVTSLTSQSAKVLAAELREQLRAAEEANAEPNQAARGANKGRSTAA